MNTEYAFGKVVGVRGSVVDVAFPEGSLPTLRVMDSAHETVEGRLDDLNALARRVRQEEVTTELLDVVTGAEALRQSGR